MKRRPDPICPLLLTVLVFLSAQAFCCTDHEPGDRHEARTTSGQRRQHGSATLHKNIILTWKGAPATSQAVTWRTDVKLKAAVVELAPADPSPTFHQNARKHRAASTALKSEDGMVYFHTVNFTGLRSSTIYAYRVGDGAIWSEWFQFQTASDKPDAFSFIYLGDAQNEIRSLWSRTIRAAIRECPKARFMIHAGDMVQTASSLREWDQWFTAGGWFFAMVPSVPAAGNHEYNPWYKRFWRLSKYWRAQFALPDEAPKGLEGTVYHVDYQGVTIVVLNSKKKLKEQAQWLDRLLSRSKQSWTIVTYHHPLYSAARGRDNKELRAAWKPIFDKHQVDLVLQGHDHVYARGSGVRPGEPGVGKKPGTIYVVSVGGPKMYRLDPTRWMKRAAENTQLFQVISIARDTLGYRAITTSGQVYDAFDLVRREDGSKEIREKAASRLPERRFK